MILGLNNLCFIFLCSKLSEIYPLITPYGWLTGLSHSKTVLSGILFGTNTKSDPLQILISWSEILGVGVVFTIKLNEEMLQLLFIGWMV